MEIIFLGGFFPKEFTSSILDSSLNQVQNSANRFQWAFINGFQQNLIESFTLVTAPSIGWFPKYYKALVFNGSIFANGNGVMVGFINLPLIKNVFKYQNLKSSLGNLINTEKNTIIIVYSLDVAYIKAALAMKVKNPNLKICVIVPDLHEFPGDAGYFYRMYIAHYEKVEFYKLISKIDGFVVLSDLMVDFLNIDKPWIRVEGLYDISAEKEVKIRIKNHTEKIILYTGSLDFKYGIQDLMNAFDRIEAQDYRLWICGGGPAAGMVAERAKSDKRITFKGLINPDEIFELQQQATLLINPRNNQGEYNKYSFPSKTMEYLASGTPTLLYKLDGIPSEYYTHCYTVEGDGIENLAKAIIDTCELSSEILNEKGVLAREFIINQKNSTIQCQKILTFLEQLCK